MILFTKILVCYTEDMTQEEEIAQLKEQLREVLEKFRAVSEQLSQVQERESHLLEQLSAEQAERHTLQESLAAAQKRIEELEKQKTAPGLCEGQCGQASRRGKETAEEA